MNMAYYQDYDDQETSYRSEPAENQSRGKISHRSKRSASFAKRKAPTSFNGIHRRRNKRFVW